ncbi:MAG: nucleoside 2-deoxyribosyltransferase domain-containing protein [Candidatus Bathyarchaeota archaeon]|nr:nucleoside 2-deoxyribosyltransferase domain-containing protein [Candidatus Termiticorpusculum sp.]
MKKQLFISGPILGMEDNQEHYRNIITNISQKLGFEVIDPWKREKYLYKNQEKCEPSSHKKYDFVQRDLDDADRCDIMVVYLPKLSAGACMEMFYAKRKGKTIIVVSDMEQLSPWIKVHCNTIIKNFDTLEETLNKFK